MALRVVSMTELRLEVAPRAPTDRRERGRGVPAPGDLPAELLPVQTALRSRGPPGSGGPFQAAPQLAVAHRHPPRGGDLPDAQGPPPVGSPADPDGAPQGRPRPAGRL